MAPADWDADQTVPNDVHDDQDVAMADGDRSSPQARPTSRPRRSSDSQPAGTDASRHNEYRYLAAVSEILHQRTTIVSLLLSHESPPAAAPATYPASAFNTSASGPSTQAQETLRASGTLSRLISADLVRDCPQAVVFRYRRAVETLLTHMSRATVMEPEEREDALRLLWPGDEQADADEMDFAFATMHLSHAVASALMAMAGILLRLCQTDLLTDVLRLVSCLIAILPRFWMDLECLQPDRQADQDEIVFLRGPPADSDQEARNLSTPIQLREILAQSINDCRPQVVADTGDASSRLADGATRKGSGDWTLSSEAREDLLQAVVGVLEAMSQCTDTSNLAIVHPLRVLQRHGALHKLLHPERPSWLILRVVRMLSSAVSDAPLVHECLASKAESDSSGRGNGPVSTRSARFPCSRCWSSIWWTDASTCPSASGTGCTAASSRCSRRRRCIRPTRRWCSPTARHCSRRSSGVCRSTPTWSGSTAGRHSCCPCGHPSSALRAAVRRAWWRMRRVRTWCRRPSAS